MISRNGVELEVGQNVLVLRTPNVEQHEFYNGVITKLTAKQVIVEGNGKQRKWNWKNGEDTFTFEYRRYPEQVIVN